MDTFYPNPAAQAYTNGQQVQNSPFPGQEAPTGAHVGMMPQHPNMHPHVQQAMGVQQMNALLHQFPMMAPAPVLPAGLGLQALYNICMRIYPNIDPLQVAARVKYWEGGPDPLDYISMYHNKGNPSADPPIPEHWHYISFGLSDIHGNGRIHPLQSSLDPSTPSGFGFELTFRLKKDPSEQSPPTWPAAVMQALAKYVYQTGNILCAGDHVSWHCPLDNSESRIAHMLMTEDSQLGSVQTPTGSVTFIQIIGVCAEELQMAQAWNGLGIIDLMKSCGPAGGEWLVTDMRRGETIFELDDDFKEAVEDGIATQGSNLSGVSAKCSFTTDLNDEETSTVYDKNSVANKKDTDDSEDPEFRESRENSKMFKGRSRSRNADGYGSEVDEPPAKRSDSQMSVSHDRQSRMSFSSETGNQEPAELLQTKFPTKLHLKFNFEAGNLLPMAIRGRLKHGRHFTFKSVGGDLAITLVTSSVHGALATRETPYAIHGPWLQVLIPEDHIDRILSELDTLSDIDPELLPITFKWSEIGLAMTFRPEE